MESRAASTSPAAESRLGPATRRIAGIFHSRAFGIQIGVALVLGAFFVVAAIAGSHGKIGGRRLPKLTFPLTVPQMAPIRIDLQKTYDPRGRYLDSGRGRNKWVLDAHGIPGVYNGERLVAQHDPAAIAQYGLWRWGKWMLTRRRSQLALARKQADWLVAHQAPATGKWLYTYGQPTYKLRAPWSSALAQGQAMSLLTRMWLQTHDPVYLRAAKRALKPLEHPVRRGGLVASLNGHPWYEEDPSRRPSFVLNGMMFTLLGLHDLRAAVPESAAGNEAGLLYRQGIGSLAFGLPKFDTRRGGQYYDLRPKRWPRCCHGYAPVVYMKLHVALLQALNSISPNPVLRHYLVRWAGGTLHRRQSGKRPQGRPLSER